MLKYSREALECVDLILNVSDEQNIRLFVLAEKRSIELIEGLIELMKSKNERIFEKEYRNELFAREKDVILSSRKINRRASKWRLTIPSIP